MWAKSFRENYCERFGCPLEAFENRVFWRCLYRRSLPLSLVVHLTNRRHFELDMQTIRQLGVCRSTQEFRAELESFRYDYRMRGSLLRQLRVRVSGKRLMALLREVLEATEQPVHRDKLLKPT